MRTLLSLRSGCFRPEPRAARVLPGGRLPSPDPLPLLRRPSPSAAKRPSGRQEAAGAAVPPLGWRQVHRVLREALGRFLLRPWPRLPSQARAGPRGLFVPCLDGKGGPFARGRREKVKHLAYKLKLGPEGKRRLAVFQELSNLLLESFVSSASPNLVGPTNSDTESGADFDAESASELRRNLRQSLPERLRRFSEGERGREWIGKAEFTCG